MKICPSCRRTYNDIDLRFCMQDGSLLQNVETTADDDLSDAPTVVRRDERTEILPPSEPVRRQEIPVAPPTTTVPRTAPNLPAPTFQATPEPKSNTNKIVLLSVLGTLALVTLGGLAWFGLSGRNKADVAETNVNVNVANTRSANVRANTNANANASNANSNSNSNSNSNVNTNANADANNINTNSGIFSGINGNISSTPAPTPKPTIAPQQARQIREELDDSIEHWRNTSQSKNIDDLLTEYAPTVDYYSGGKISSAQVRTDKQKAFNDYEVVEFDITNVKVTPDASGEKAVVTFDKEWNFENDVRYNRGKVMQQLIYERIKGEWKITGERDLKVYMSDKGEF